MPTRSQIGRSDLLRLKDSINVLVAAFSDLKTSQDYLHDSFLAHFQLLQNQIQEQIPTTTPTPSAEIVQQPTLSTAGSTFDTYPYDSDEDAELEPELQSQQSLTQGGNIVAESMDEGIGLPTLGDMIRAAENPKEDGFASRHDEKLSCGGIATGPCPFLHPLGNNVSSSAMDVPIVDTSPYDPGPLDSSPSTTVHNPLDNPLDSLNFQLSQDALRRLPSTCIIRFAIIVCKFILHLPGCNTVILLFSNAEFWSGGNSNPHDSAKIRFVTDTHLVFAEMPHCNTVSQTKQPRQIQWPPFLLASKFPVAVFMAKDNVGKRQELKKRRFITNHTSPAAGSCPHTGSYMAFGTFLMCFDRYSTCFANPVSILAIFEGSIQSQVIQPVDYRTIVDTLCCGAICKDFTALAESMGTHSNSLHASISSQLGALGLTSWCHSLMDIINLGFLARIYLLARSILIECLMECHWKISFISMMIGLTKPTSGMAFVQGQDIKTHMDGVDTSMGVWPQYDLLWEHLTDKELLFFYGSLKNLKGLVLAQVTEESLKSVTFSMEGVLKKNWHYFTQEGRHYFKREAIVDGLAKLLIAEKSLLIFRRGYNYATTSEGDLNVREVAIWNIDGITAGEIKHGPLALVNDGVEGLLTVVRKIFIMVLTGSVATPNSSFLCESMNSANKFIMFDVSHILLFGAFGHCLVHWQAFMHLNLGGNNLSTEILHISILLGSQGSDKHSQKEKTIGSPHRTRNLFKDNVEVPIVQGYTPLMLTVPQDHVFAFKFPNSHTVKWKQWDPGGGFFVRWEGLVELKAILQFQP